MGNKKSKPTIVPIKEQQFALCIVNPQKDFFKNGSFELKNAEDIIGPINKLRFYCYKYMPTIFSQIFHPKMHISFASTHNALPFELKSTQLELIDGTLVRVHQKLYPDFCVQGTRGCELHNDLIQLHSDRIFRIGTIINIPTYSAFGDEQIGRNEDSGVHDWLKTKQITDLVIIGIGIDTYVYNTALDASIYGFNVHIILSCVTGFENPDILLALAHMKEMKNITFYEDVDVFYEICIKKLKNKNN